MHEGRLGGRRRDGLRVQEENYGNDAVRSWALPGPAAGRAAVRPVGMVLTTRTRSRRGAAWWYLLAFLACLSVLAVNGGLLVYFDTDGYLQKGEQILARLGVEAPADPGAAVTATPSQDRLPGTGEARTGEARTGAARAGVRNVDGSHSAVYSLLMAVFARLGALEGMVVLNAAVVVLVAGFTAREMQRIAGPATVPGPALAALPVLAAATTALPFYVGYLMPDIFTPVTILIVALLTVFARQMGWRELALAMGLGWLAVLSHLSHLAIVALLVPAAALGALVLARRRWWLPPLLVAGLLVVPYAEKQLFRVSVEATSNARVSYKPFITARLIQDGPGLTWLDAHCPDAAIASCALWEKLQDSDDPWRLTASHILFKEDDRLGSFQRLDVAAQRAVSEDQVGFFLAVLRDLPLQTVQAFLGNMLLQAGMVSVEMTMPDDAILRRVERHGDALGLTQFGPGRLGADQAWLPGLTRVHEVIYAVSTLAILGLILWPRRLPPPARIFGAMVLAGILANALVCGGISQPATRYGARVAWLLPFTSVLLALLAAGFRPEPGRHGRA